MLRFLFSFLDWVVNEGTGCVAGDCSKMSFVGRCATVVVGRNSNRARDCHLERERGAELTFCGGTKWCGFVHVFSLSSQRRPGSFLSNMFYT